MGFLWPHPKTPFTCPWSRTSWDEEEELNQAKLHLAGRPYGCHPDFEGSTSPPPTSHQFGKIPSHHICDVTIGRQISPRIAQNTFHTWGYLPNASSETEQDKVCWTGVGWICTGRPRLFQLYPFFTSKLVTISRILTLQPAPCLPDHPTHTSYLLYLVQLLFVLVTWCSI
jgi:hypothetical protein